MLVAARAAVAQPSSSAKGTLDFEGDTAVLVAVFEALETEK